MQVTKLSTHTILRAYFSAKLKDPLRKLIPLICRGPVDTAIEILETAISVEGISVSQYTQSRLFCYCCQIAKLQPKDTVMKINQYRKIIRLLSNLFNNNQKFIIFRLLLIHPHKTVNKILLKSMRDYYSQKDVNRIEELYLKYDDEDFLRNVLLSKTRLLLSEPIFKAVEKFYYPEFPYFVSRALGHLMVSADKRIFLTYINQYKECAIYAVGYSNNFKLKMEVRKLFNHYPTAVTWALGKLKDRVWLEKLVKQKIITL